MFYNYLLTIVFICTVVVSGLWRVPVTNAQTQPSKYINIEVPITNDGVGQHPLRCGQKSNCPWYVDIDKVRWSIKTDLIDGTYSAMGHTCNGKDELYYKTVVHTCGSRSCAVKSNADYEGDFNYINGRIFTLDGFTGNYYISFQAYCGTTNTRQKEYRVINERSYIYIRVPPVNSFSLPYSPPAGNRKPVPVVIIDNSIIEPNSGSGKRSGDPIITRGQR